MGQVHKYGVESTAAIAGHPIHPFLICLPVGFLIGSLGTDIVYMLREEAFWAHASYWLINASVVTLIAAAIPGAIDGFTIAKARTLPSFWVHFIGNLLVLALAVINAFGRAATDVTVSRGGLGLTIATVAILAVTGWMGGELIARHRIGIARSLHDHL